ncbi:MAG: S8 family serine peptidase [Acidobacteria bacterium Pan2503]|uniref:S8 family serine peptidase n=1 Tax=Candidatus Acidiferrum panamense TaxID=2741543 RepID=A0A7V8NUY5_9BACT|nr:S8 family serine peptidase [Candidatus Acidoferrum panamensis]
MVGTLDGSLGQLFLVTTPLPLANLLGLLNGVAGFVDAEVDQVLSLVGGLNVVPTPLDPTLMSDRTPMVYPAGSTTTAWNSYVNQPAAGVVEVQTAQSDFHVTGTGIVGDIDTGVDPNHSVLKGVLLPGYDFTRNQPGASEMNDLPSGFPTPSCTTTCSGPAQVNQSTAAVLDQSTAAVLDTQQYAAFGHGTMVMGIIHLVAPTAELLPLKSFKSDGTGNLSDILRAIYYAVQEGKANVINMSFDLKTSSTELKNALDYANQLGLTCVASAGNDGAQEIVYPAALQTDVMGVASVGSTTATDGTRSSFSNYGNSVVWVAAPGEQIVTTYPFSAYAAGWGTSFSAPFVSGGGALLHALRSAITESESATATANAAPLTPTGMGHGRLDLVPALQSLAGGGGGNPDYTVSVSPLSQTIAAGQTATFTLSTAPANGFNQTVTWSCMGAPAGATCSVSPSMLTLDGTHTATATVTLTTTARSMVSLPNLPRASPLRLPSYAWALRLACVVVLAALLGFCGQKWSSELRLRPAKTAAVVALSLCACSCGGGSGGGGPGPPALYSITLNPSTVTGGATATGEVTLNQLAPNGGASISLSSNSAAATVPASVTVTAGEASATFTVGTGSVATSTPVTITGSYGGVTKTSTLTVMPVSSGGTPAGTYSLTLTGTSGNLSHSTTVQLIVN